MKPAEVSLAVNTNSTGLRPRASMSGSTGPLGMPNTPADSGLLQHADNGLDVGHNIERLGETLIN